MILTANITLPDDTVSVGNVMVFAYSDDDIGGRLLSHPVNTSGTTRASPEAQMVRKFKLETANVTLTSQLTKNSTTNRFKVRAVLKIALSSSTLYLQSLMIRKILFVVTSYGQDDRRNEKQYLIFYSKSVIVPSPLVLSNASSVADSTVRKPISVVPSPVRSTVALSSSVVRETDKPPVTGTGNRYEAIISVPIVVLAVLIALLSWCYCKRSRRQNDPENIAVQLDSSESTV